MKYQRLVAFIFLLFNVFIQEVFGQCGCPAVKTIDAAGILKLPESKYLGTRKTHKPTFTMSGCSIILDFSKVVPNDFELMIFRKNAPPIFNYRFVKTMKKSVKVSPIGISCVRVNGVYEWQLYGGKITDMAIALQEPECNCVEPIYFRPKPNTVEKGFGACDVYAALCEPKKFPELVSGPRAMGRLESSSMIFTDSKCVAKKWYYNSKPINPSLSGQPMLECDYEASEYGTYKDYYCGCREIEKMSAPDSKLTLFYNYPEVPSYQNLQYRDGIISYDTNKCTAKISCYGSDTLVLFLQNMIPVKYGPSTSPYISCHPSTNRPFPDTKITTKKQWYMDGIMINGPIFSCIQEPGCLCKYVPLTSANIQKLVGSYSFYPLIASRPIRTPTDNRSGLVCPSKSTCPANYSLVVFDNLNASVFPSGSMTMICDTKTRQWAVEKTAHIPNTEVIFAVCVNFN
uniref:DUF4789 domain-containing protein n=1 Tax=Caenorhabditis tropicalis TaxID=1561998 RepID=A0A1I7TCB0_9PELO